jgi:hypothetical protein
MAKLIFGRFCLILFAVLTAASVAVAQTESNTTPKITSVSKITTAEHQTITITGTGFGTHKAYTGDSKYIAVDDETRSWQAGYSGFNDTVTLIVNSWTATKITLGGFAGAWGTHNYTLAVGDSVEVQVWNAQSDSGPASKTVTVSKAATSMELTSLPNPSAYGEPVTFTAILSSDAGVPDGETVSFMKGTTVLGTGTLKDGSASFTTSMLEPGDNAIKAVYSGDSNFAGSTSCDDDSPLFTQTVK